MKKAEEYIKRLSNQYGDYGIITVFTSDALKVLKQAQIDAIEETVKRCADVAEIKEFDITPQDRNSIGNDMGSVYAVDKEAILNLADGLKKELE